MTAASFLPGQVVSIRLEGVVSDPSQAVVPGAAATARNVATNISYQAVTNEAGRYVFVTLPPGPYSLTVSLPGFKKAVRDGIALKVGDAITINMILEPGGTHEIVTVTEQAPLLDQTTAKLGAVIEHRQTQELPLPDRNTLMLYYLASGMNVYDRMAGSGSQQQVGGADGLAPHTGNTKVEGVFASHADFDFSPADIAVPIPQEAMGEYRITTSGGLPDTGRGSGAQVSVSLKSGTNNFHGSLFEFNRNEAYNANTFFNNRAGTPRSSFKRNQFGWSLGGPIIRNRTFFFGTMEWDRRKASSVQNYTVYTQTLRDGIFRYHTQGPNSGSNVDGSGNPRVPFGTINLLTVDPTRQGKDTFFLPKLLAAMPLPNNYDVGDGFNLGGYRFLAPASTPSDQQLFKIDHKFSARHQLAISASRSVITVPYNFLITGKPGEIYQTRKRGIQLRLVSTFTTRFINELSVGGNRVWFKSRVQTDQETPTGGVYPSGLSGNYLYVQNRGLQSNPGVNLGFSDGVTWIKGNHTMSFGGESWLQTLNIKVGAGGWPSIDTSNASNPANVPALPGLNPTDRGRAQQLTNDLTGAIGNIRQSFFLTDKTGYAPYGPSYMPIHNVEWSLYMQDLWKVMPNFSLSLGWRFEVLPLGYMANDIYIQPVGGVAGALGIQGPTGQPTRFGLVADKGRAAHPTDRNNFAPYLGFSWDPFAKGRTTISGYYRISYDRSMLITQALFSSINYGATTTVTLNPFARLSDPNLYKTILPIPVPQVFAPLGFTRDSTAYALDPNLATPYVQGWSLRIGQQVGRNWNVEAAYVGNHAVGQWQAPNLNQVEMRKNGFLDAFKIAQGNLAQNGSPTKGASLGSLTSLFTLIPSSQFTLIAQGQAAALANFLDTTPLTTGNRGGLIELAGLPATFFRFNPQVLHLNVIGNTSHSTYDALKLSVTRRFAAGLFLQGNYTLAKGFTNYVPNQSVQFAYRDNANPHLDKALSPYNALHTVVANWLYELPFGKDKRFLHGTSRLLQGFLGGWQVNGIFNWATGRPLAITTNRAYLNQNVASTPNFSGDRFDLSKPFDDGSRIITLTPARQAQLSNPGPGEAGNLPRYSLRGPGIVTFDMSMFKNFPVELAGRGIKAQFRLELFNVFNKVNFLNPNVDINSGSFGVVTSAWSPRMGQIALKILF